MCVGRENVECVCVCVCFVVAERCCPCRGGSDGRGGAPAEAFQPARPVDVPVWDAVTPNYVYFAADERPRRTMGGADRIEVRGSGGCDTHVTRRFACIRCRRRTW